MHCMVKKTPQVGFLVQWKNIHMKHGKALTPTHGSECLFEIISEKINKSRKTNLECVNPSDVHGTITIYICDRELLHHPAFYHKEEN